MKGLKNRIKKIAQNYTIFMQQNKVTNLDL